ncbi:MAG TPA: quinol:electron acceptor oxidoreductase subunit ActD, partial [Anaeromyxobacter sp.]
AAAIRALRGKGLRVTAAMPAPFPEVVQALGRPTSPVGYATLPGAVVGVALGVALTVGTSLAWPIVTGGKPVVSVPPFVIVIFEVAVLVGSLVNLVAVAVGTRFGARAAAFPPGLSFNADLVGVFAEGGALAPAEAALRAAGAVEVRRVG